MNPFEEDELHIHLQELKPKKKPRERTRRKARKDFYLSKHASERYRERFPDVPKGQIGEQIQGYIHNAQKVIEEGDVKIYINCGWGFVTKGFKVITIMPSKWLKENRTNIT